MSNAKHTPGPWIIDIFYPTKVRASGKSDGNQIVICETSLQSYIHACNLTLYTQKDEKFASQIRNDIVMLERAQLANAKLIAAAPELLEALQKIGFTLMSDEVSVEQVGEMITLCKAAIKKATE